MFKPNKNEFLNAYNECFNLYKMNHGNDSVRNALYDFKILISKYFKDERQEFKKSFQNYNLRFAQSRYYFEELAYFLNSLVKECKGECCELCGLDRNAKCKNARYLWYYQFLLNGIYGRII